MGPTRSESSGPAQGRPEGAGFVTQLVLLLAGVVTFLVTMSIQRSSHGGFPLFIISYAIALAMVLAGFGAFAVPGLE